MDLRDREHGGAQGRGVARDDGLQLLHELCRDHDRIARLVRHGRMAARALDDDVEEARPGHGGAGLAENAPRRGVGVVVQPVELVAGKALEQAFRDHPARTAEPFLGGLEDQHCRAGEVARRREIAGGAEQDRGMAVMAAGMHLAGIARGIGQVRGLGDRQRIHVGAQADAALAGLLAVDDADDTGPGNALMHLVDPPVAQRLRHDPRRARLLEADLGMRVQIAADRGEFVLITLDEGDGGHGLSPETVSGDHATSGSRSIAARICPRGLAVSARVK